MSAARAISLRSIFKRCLLLILVALMGISMLSVIWPSKSAAAAALTYSNDPNAAQKIKAIRYVTMFKKTSFNDILCSKKAKTSISSAEIDNGPLWWIDNGTKVHLGMAVAGNSEERACNDATWNNEMFTILGYKIGNGPDNRATLGKLGYACAQDSSGSWACTNPIANDGTSWTNQLIANSPYLNGVDPTKASDLQAMSWVAANSIIDSICELKPGGSSNTVSRSSIDQNTGKITTASYGSNDKSSIWAGVGTGGWGVAGGLGTVADYYATTCKTLALITVNYADAAVAWMGQNWCRNDLTPPLTSESDISACAKGWANKTDYSVCVNSYKGGVGTTTPTSGDLASIAQRAACFRGQQLGTDSATGGSIGEKCYSKYPNDTNLSTACIKGALNSAGSTDYCNSAYPTSDNLNTNGNSTAQLTQALDRHDACAYGAGTAVTASTDGSANSVNIGGPTCSALDSSGCVAETALLDCGGGAINFFLCPVIKLMGGAAASLDRVIMERMNVDTDATFDRNQTTGDAYYKAWNSFRIIAVAILIIAGLVIVVSQAMGLEIFAAYTVKKALPRLIVAAIGITLSWPLLIFMINLFNTLGIDVRQLLYSPFSLLNSHVTGGTGFLSTLLTAGVLYGMGPVSLTYLITAVLAAFIGYVILVLREIAIVALVIVAPIAIACYILPNTQKAWQSWSKTFLGLLLMFPIISAFIAVGHIFAAISMGDGTSLTGQVIGLIAYFAPYFMIPVAARMAGGAIGQLAGVVNDRGRGVFDRLKGVRQTSGAQHREHIGRGWLQRRAEVNSRLQAAGSSSTNKLGSFGRRAARVTGRVVGGYNIESSMSARRGAVGKEVSDQIASGADDEVRALNVRRDASEANGFKRVQDGKIQYKTIGGRWVDEAAVVRARQRWGNDTFAQQAALSYEMSKASSEEEVQSIAKNYTAVARDTWGMSKRQRDSAWIGASFSNQNLHLEYKGMSEDAATGEMRLGGAGGSISGYNKLVDEIYERRGSYNLAQMGSNTVEELKRAHTAAGNLITANSAAAAAGDAQAIATVTSARDTQQKVAAIAETFMHEYSTVAPGQGNTPPVQAAPGQPQGRRSAATPGSAHTAERVRELAEMTGMMGAGPTGLYNPGHAPTPNRREQS